MAEQILADVIRVTKNTRGEFTGEALKKGQWAKCLNTDVPERGVELVMRNESSGVYEFYSMVEGLAAMLSQGTDVVNVSNGSGGWSATAMTSANVTSLTNGSTTSLHYHDADRSRVNHTGTQSVTSIGDLDSWLASEMLRVESQGSYNAFNLANGSGGWFTSHTDGSSLSGGSSSELHYHSSDRIRSNHTGTQSATTIGDIDSYVQSLVGAKGLADYVNVSNGSGGWNATDILIQNGSISNGTSSLTLGTSTATLTSGTESMVLYVDGTATLPGATTSTINSRGDTAILNKQYMKDIFAVTKEPTGWDVPSNVKIEYDPTTRKVTLSPYSGTITAYHQGVAIPELTISTTWESTAHDVPVGQQTFFLYHNGSSVVWSTSPWTLDTVQIALVYRDGVNFCVRECHGMNLPYDAHYEMHYMIGTWLRSGGDLSNYVLSSTTATDRRPQIASTTLRDEDNPTTLPALTTNAYAWFQLTGSGSGTQNVSVDNAEIVSIAGGGTPYYNQYTGGSWTQTAMANNEYQKLYVMAIPVSDSTACQKSRYVFIQGQSVSTTLATIQAITPASMSWGTLATALTEYCMIAEIIIKATSNNWTIYSVAKITGSKISQTSNPALVTPSLSSVLGAGNDGGGLLVKNIGDGVDAQDAVTLKQLRTTPKIKPVNGLMTGQMMDVGSNWTMVEIGANIEQVNAITYLEDGIVIIGTGISTGDGDIYRSIDYGLTWSAIEMGSGLEYIRSLCYLGNGIVLAGSGASTGDGDVYRSTDYGLTWTAVEIGASIEMARVLCYLGNGIVLLGTGLDAGDGDIYRSTDYGATWSSVEMGASLEYISTICYLGGGIVISGSGLGTGDGDVYRSTDYGSTWSAVEMGADLEYVLSSCYLGNGVVLVGTGSSTGDGDVYRSTDYGLTWTKIEMGSGLEYIYTLCNMGDGIVLAGGGLSTGDGDVYRSTDYGLTWTAVEMGASLEVILSICNADGIAIAGSGLTAGDGDVYLSYPAVKTKQYRRDFTALYHKVGSISYDTSVPISGASVNSLGFVVPVNVEIVGIGFVMTAINPAESSTVTAHIEYFASGTQYSVTAGTACGSCTSGALAVAGYNPTAYSSVSGGKQIPAGSYVTCYIRYTGTPNITDIAVNVSFREL